MNRVTTSQSPQDGHSKTSNSPLSDAPPAKSIATHIKHCRDITVHRACSLFQHYLKAWYKRLQSYREHARNEEDKASFLALQKTLNKHAKQLTKIFCHFVESGFHEFAQYNKSMDKVVNKEGESLSLVELEDLDENIAVYSISQRAEVHYAEQLWLLNERFAILNGGKKIKESGNPVAPVQFCDSLRRSLSTIALPDSMRAAAYKIFDKEFISQLSTFYQDLNRYLVKQKVLPDLIYTPDHLLIHTRSSPMSAPAQAAPVHEAAPACSNQTTSAMGHVDTAQVGHTNPHSQGHQIAQDNLVTMIKALQKQVAGFSPITTEPRTEATVLSPLSSDNYIYTQSQLVEALKQLQMKSQTISFMTPAENQSDAAPLQPYDVQKVGHRLAAELQKETQENGQIDTDGLHTIELVGMLFEYMLSDDNLPNSVKTLLSYLHTPILKVAFMDADFFTHAEHPARLLLNSLADAGGRWVGDDGPSQYDIYKKIEEVVLKIQQDTSGDIQLFKALLFDFTAYTKKIARRQELFEKRAMEKAKGEEQLQAVKQKVKQVIRTRIKERELPSVALLFLLHPWSDYMAFVLLRFGERSNQWEQALTIVDDFLTSISLKIEELSSEAIDKQKTDNINLLTMVERALQVIGYDRTRAEKLLDAMQSLQEDALESSAARPDVEPEHQQIVEASDTREKMDVLPEAEEKKDVLPVVKESEHVMPATTIADNESQQSEVSPQEEKMVEQLKMIEFGTWFEFSEGRRLKVAWYNGSKHQYLLVDQMGKKVAMISSLELAREMLSGKARIIAGSAKPFFDRALENIYQSLQAQAQAAEGTA